MFTGTVAMGLIGLLALVAAIPAADAARSPFGEAAGGGGKQHAVHHLPDEALTGAGPVTSLPGFKGKMPSYHEAGYVDVGGKGSRKMFYYFVACENNAIKDAPVVLWLNGGPGCSSFDGFVYEHGPFSFNWAEGVVGGDVELSLNPWSWSKVANVLYLDSPAGVGYSYTTHPEDLVTNDTHTAHDTNTFLRKWLAGRPVLAARDFYVSGESYAGIYVPTLAQRIAHGNDAGETPTIRLAGYAVGNGCTDEKVDGNAYIPYAFGKSLIDLDTFHGVRRACNHSYWNAEGVCAEKVNAIQANLLDQLNLYDTLKPCYHPQGPAAGRAALKAAAAKSAEAGKGGAMSWPLGGAVREGRVPTWQDLGVEADPEYGVSVPCIDSRIAHKWLNMPETRLALHAEPADVIGPWNICSDKVEYTHDMGSMIPIHQELSQARGIRALIYSGDHDLCVPHTGSERWTRELGAPVIDEWRPWIVNDQVAGYSRAYKGLTYATMMGAGHTVPQYKPRNSLALLKRFLADTPL